MFYVGQKVVCVDDRFAGAGDLYVNQDGSLCISDGNTGGLIKGATYTISGLNVGSVYTSVWLLEIPLRCSNDQGFRAFRFRPIIEKKTDISVFEEILRRETIDDRERVS